MIKNPQFSASRFNHAYCQLTQTNTNQNKMNSLKYCKINNNNNIVAY